MISRIKSFKSTYFGIAQPLSNNNPISTKFCVVSAYLQKREVINSYCTCTYVARETGYTYGMRMVHMWQSHVEICNGTMISTATYR